MVSCFRRRRRCLLLLDLRPIDMSLDEVDWRLECLPVTELILGVEPEKGIISKLGQWKVLGKLIGEGT